MMIGVAHVIGMKPTFRSFFSTGALWAKASVTLPSGRNWAMAATAVDVPTAFRNARRVRIMRKERTHDGAFYGALQILFGRYRDIMFGLVRVGTARAAATVQSLSGIKRILKAHRSRLAHT